MDLRPLLQHIDFTNPVSWVALAGFALALVNTFVSIAGRIGDRGRLRLEAMVQGPHRGSWDETARLGDGITLTIRSAGTKPVAVSHICGERMIDGFRAQFELHQHPRKEWVLAPGVFRTTWALDPKALDHLLWLGVEDTLGHRWKLSRWQLTKLKRHEDRARRNAMVALCKGAPEDVVH
jgi:hypothetical protein